MLEERGRREGYLVFTHPPKSSIHLSTHLVGVLALLPKSVTCHYVPRLVFHSTKKEFCGTRLPCTYRHRSETKINRTTFCREFDVSKEAGRGKGVGK